MKHSRLSNNEGVTLVILAVVLLMLISIAALALDLGRLYVGKQRAQNVADASALAGALFLTGTPDGEPASQNAAETCAISNNETSTGSHWFAKNPDTGEPGVMVTFPTSFTTDAGETMEVSEGEAIMCDTEVPVEFTFAKVMNWNSANAPARAIAALVDATTVTGQPPPIGVPVSEIWNGDGNPAISPGAPETLKVVSWQDQPIGSGNFGAISYEGDSGGNDYRQRLAGNPDVSPVTLSVDMTVDTLPGNKIGPTDQAMKTRLAGDTYTYESWKETYDPATGTFAETNRVFLIPIIEVNDGVSGSKEVKVVGFAAFFIENYDSKSGEVTGYFMQALSVGDTIKYNPYGTLKSGTNTLVQTVKLVG